MTTQGLIYSEEVIYETEEVVYLTLEPDPRCSFDSIPNELIEHHIFGYFWFHYWTQHFVSVCKRWKQICENTTITPKHLRISPKPHTIVDVGKAIFWVKKHQPTILELNLDPTNYFCNFAIQALVLASECIDTLILSNNRIVELLKPSPAFARITTLVLNGTLSNEIFQLFPALQRLQIRIQQSDVSANIKLPVKELTVIDPKNSDFYLQHVDVPKLTLVSDNKVFKKIDGIITELRMPDLTYEEYFRYFGKTKMFVMMSNLNTAAAAKFLETSTSYEYEADLIENNLYSYRYPTNINITNYDSVFALYYYKQNPGLLSNKLPAGADINFELFMTAGDVQNAIAVLSKRGATIHARKNQEISLLRRFVTRSQDYDPDFRISITDTFFKLLSHPQVNASTFHNENARQAAKVIIRSEIKDGCTLLRTLQQFEKIADVLDWSETFAKVNDYDLFWAMIKKGAKMPYQALRDQALNPEAKEPSLKIIQEVTKQDPSIWYDILALTSPENALKIMERYGVSPLIEKDGKALWQAWYAEDKQYSSLTVTTVNGRTMPMYPDVYTNHMDSSGLTILLMLIESLDGRPSAENRTERYLQDAKGIDTNQHRHGRLSPLATLLVKCASKPHSCCKLIVMLVHYGADVNLACTFEGRQCSPLMIAVLVGSPLPTISLLIALGARTNYCDDHGRSIVDCFAEGENKYEASEYQSLKLLLLQ